MAPQQQEKPRVRVPSNNVPTSDSFVNFAARLGLGANNQFSAGHYDFNLRQNSPAFELGFRPINTENVGPRKQPFTKRVLTFSFGTRLKAKFP